MSGKFITFEGIEGCGKTTQIHLLNDYLLKQKRHTLLSREPGGTPIGENIRKVLLASQFQEMFPITELLLYAASRYQHIHEVILPAIEAGKIILCDRFADATQAYQGGARKIEPEFLKNLHALVVGKLKPDLTILLDCPVEASLKRIQKRKLDRLEKEAIDFHERVRAEYLKMASAEPERIKKIDAQGTMEAIHKKIVKEVTRIL